MAIVPQDLTGQRFGRWTVIRRAKQDKHYNTWWDCVCDCGTTRMILGGRLRNGNSRDCGCILKERQAQDIAALIGLRFGRLIIVSDAGRHHHAKRVLCQCDCGERVVVRVEHLGNGVTTSCGCFAREATSKRTRIADGEAAFNTLYTSYRTTAVRRGRAFDLTSDQFRYLTLQDCYYCGAHPSQIQEGHATDYIYSGVDRIDNKQGYCVDNVVSCCKQCNYAKGVLSQAEFFDLIRRIYEKHFD